MKKKIVFIINPISGVHSKINLPEIIKHTIDSTKYDYILQLTQRPGHATQLAEKAISEKADVIVSVGGDGTLNEIAKVVTGTSVLLGIIPLGSGNGLARHLGIPLRINDAVQLLNRNKVRTIDVCKLNDRFFFSNAGSGFVARVAHSFHHGKIRGFTGYTLHVIKNFFGYNSQIYSLEIDGKKVNGEYFLINISNSNQFGYNLKIAPVAELNDGLMDLILVRTHSKFSSIPLMLDLFNGKIQKNKNVTVEKIKHIKIFSKGNIEMQVDGEPLYVTEDIDISIHPASLKVICP